MSVVSLTVPLELSDAGALIPIPAGGGSGNGTIFTVDTAGYNSISVQLSGVWEADVTFQTSNDAVNWVNTQGFAFNSGLTSTDTAVDNDVYLCPVIGRYFQAVVTGYQAGPIKVTAYLRFQSIAGLGEAMMSQSMDSSTGTPQNVTFQGVQGPGQQPAANSVPVTLSNENIQDKYITGRAFTQTTTYLNYNMLLDAKDSAINPGAPIDCLQYRSIFFQYNSVGPAGGTNTVNSNFIPEVSNDLVNWVNVSMYRLEGGSAVSISETRNFNPVNYGSSAYFGANLMMRYFRLRCNNFGTTGFIQFTTILRMAPQAYQTQAYANIAQTGGSNLSSGTTNFASSIQSPTTTGTNSAATNPPILVGGTDKSVVRQEFTGAPLNANPNAYLFGGPWVRQGTYDVAGAAAVAGPPGWLAEEKTTPVNVRLERTTNSQDSVQDLLQQILVEMKALNYYTRETPIALNLGLSTSLMDEPENFADDPSIYSRNQKGH